MVPSALWLKSADVRFIVLYNIMYNYVQIFKKKNDNFDDFRSAGAVQNKITIDSCTRSLNHLLKHNCSQ